MSNYDNIRDHGFDRRTADERRELARKAGQASGEARRRKANFRKTLNQLLTTKIDSPEWTPILEKIGVDSTLESAVNMAMIRQALDGNVKAYEAIARYSGQTAQTDTEEKNIKADTALKEARTKGMTEDGSKTAPEVRVIIDV